MSGNGGWSLCKCDASHMAVASSFSFSLTGTPALHPACYNSFTCLISALPRIMAMRLLVDPSLNMVLDFATEYADIIAMLVATGNFTREATLAAVKAPWDAKQVLLTAQWQQQTEDDQAAAKVACLEAEQAEQEKQQREMEQELQAQALKDHEAEEEKREKEKKQPKVNSLANNHAASTDSITRPSPYTIERLKQLRYVPLHYFTVKRCNKAVCNNDFLAKDTFTISTDDDVLLL